MVILERQLLLEGWQQETDWGRLKTEGEEMKTVYVGEIFVETSG